MRLRKILATPALALLVATGACDEGLTGINRNPNSPEEVPAANLLVNAITDAVGASYGTHGVWAGLYLTNIWSQQIAEVKYNDEDRYIPRPTQVDGIWDQMYTGPLADLKLIKEIAEEEGDDNLFAVAEIMSQYLFHYLTDIYGDIPYSEALAGAENTHPKYDSQQDVYNGILANLAAAVERIDPGKSTASFRAGDELYHGDMEKWRKFANSLRMRVAMRLAQVNPEKARTEFVAAYNAGGFASNADNASLVWGVELLSQNPRYDYWYNQDRYDFVMSHAMISRLQAYDDPRLPIYADTAKGGVYRGLPNGKLPGDFNLNVPDYSPVGAFFLKPDAPSDLMTYAEVLFLQAEAAERGWIPGSAADLYQQAITASMKQYGISDGAITAYLAQPSVAYAGLNSIWEQKWIALFMNGPEAWAEVRRTGVPDLVPAAGDEIPSRLPYPTGEQLYNPENWASAGGKDVTLWTKMWWMAN